MVEALVDWSKDVESGASNTRLLVLLLVSNGRRNCIAPYLWNPSLHFTDPPTILPHFSSLTNIHTHIDREIKNSFFQSTTKEKYKLCIWVLFLFSNKTMGHLWFWKTMMGFGGFWMLQKHGTLCFFLQGLLCCLIMYCLWRGRRGTGSSRWEKDV